LRRIEATLAKAKEYTEAQKVKMKADQLEKWELEDLRKDWAQKKEVKKVCSPPFSPSVLFFLSLLSRSIIRYGIIGGILETTTS
jgi:hypothetical protein